MTSATPNTPEAQLARIVATLEQDQARSFDGFRRDPGYGRLLNWLRREMSTQSPATILDISDTKFRKASGMGPKSLTLWRQYQPAP